MGSTQQFCLKWNNHQSNMLSIFDQLLSSEHFVDVTLACDGLSVRAHKMVLSACSPFFQSLFIQNPCEHPIVILKDIRFVDLKALVQFMYRGEVNVSQDQLPTLLKAAEALKIKGLAEVTNESGSQKPGVPSVPPGSVGGPLGASLGGGHTHSHNGHLAKSEQAAQLAQQQPSVQAAAAVAAASPLAQSLAPAAAAAQNALVAAMQQTALKQAQAQLVQAAQAAQAAQERQNATSQSLSAASMASHESNSNASTPLRQTDSPMSQQNRKRRRKSAGSEKGSGDEGSGVESGAEDNLDETRGASDDESAGEEAEFEPSKLLEQSMTEVRQGAGHQDNNSSSSDNLTKDDIKPAINFDAATPGALASLNTQDPTAVLAFAAAAQAAQGASGGAGDSVAGPSQPTHAVCIAQPDRGSPRSKCSGGLIPASTSASACTRALCATASSTSTLSTFISPLSDRGEYRYLCRICGFMAKRRKQALEHQYKHLENYPYQCSKCDYGTVRSFNLKRHYGRIHSIVATDVSDDENTGETDTGGRGSDLKQTEYHPHHHHHHHHSQLQQQQAQPQAYIKQRDQEQRPAEHQQQLQQQTQLEQQYRRCALVESSSEQEHHHRYQQQQEQQQQQQHEQQEVRRRDQLAPQHRQQVNSAAEHPVNTDASDLTTDNCTAIATEVTSSHSGCSNNKTQLSATDSRCIICTPNTTPPIVPVATQSVVSTQLDISGRCRPSPQVTISLTAGTVATVTTTTRIGIVAQQSQIFTSTPVTAFGTPPTAKRPLLVAVPGVGAIAPSVGGASTNLSSAIPFAAQALQELSRAPRLGVFTQQSQQQHQIESHQALLSQPVGRDQSNSLMVAEYSRPLCSTPTLLRTMTPVGYASAISAGGDSGLFTSIIDDPPETDGPEEIIEEQQHPHQKQLSPMSTANSGNIQTTSTCANVSEFTPQSSREFLDDPNTIMQQRLRSVCPPEERGERLSPPTGAARRKFRLPYQFASGAALAAATSGGCNPCSSRVSPDLSSSRNLRTAIFKSNRSVRRHSMNLAEGSEPREIQNRRIQNRRDRRRSKKRPTTARAVNEESSSCSEGGGTRHEETTSDSDCLVIEEATSDMDDMS